MLTRRGLRWEISLFWLIVGVTVVIQRWWKSGGRMDMGERVVAAEAALDAGATGQEGRTPADAQGHLERAKSVRAA